MHRNVTQDSHVEDVTLLRTRDNFRSDCAALNPNGTGIKTQSVLHTLPSFHVVENYAVDVMHDFFEGVCIYNMSHILNYFITMKYYTLQEINDLKATFCYGDVEVGNVCNDFTI